MFRKVYNLLTIQNGMSALILASQRGYIEVVKLLLQLKAHIDAQSKVRWNT